jgi:uncharacterized membrane protein
MMRDSNPDSTAVRVGRNPIYPTLAPFPFACFAGALVTDLAYWRSADVMWERFSIWLITAGLVMAAFAAIAALIDFSRSDQIRASMLAWLYAAGSSIAIFLALINAFVHSRDGYTAVVPTGLMLSGLVVVILLFTSWVSGVLEHRNSAGASL